MREDDAEHFEAVAEAMDVRLAVHAPTVTHGTLGDLQAGPRREGEQIEIATYAENSTKRPVSSRENRRMGSGGGGN